VHSNVAKLCILVLISSIRQSQQRGLLSCSSLLLTSRQESKQKPAILSFFGAALKRLDTARGSDCLQRYSPKWPVGEYARRTLAEASEVSSSHLVLAARQSLCSARQPACNIACAFCVGRTSKAHFRRGTFAIASARGPCMFPVVAVPACASPDARTSICGFATLLSITPLQQILATIPTGVALRSEQTRPVQVLRDAGYDLESEA
jgi:hypothetical protein